MRDKSKICLPKVCSDWTLDARKIKDTKRLSVSGKSCWNVKKKNQLTISAC